MKNMKFFVPLFSIGAVLFLGNTSVRAMKQESSATPKKVRFGFSATKDDSKEKEIDRVVSEVFDLENPTYIEVRGFLAKFKINGDLQNCSQENRIAFIQTLRELFYRIGYKKLYVYYNSKIKDNIYYLATNWEKIKIYDSCVFVNLDGNLILDMKKIEDISKI